MLNEVQLLLNIITQDFRVSTKKITFGIVNNNLKIEATRNLRKVCGPPKHGQASKPSTTTLRATEPRIGRKLRGPHVF